LQTEAHKLQKRPHILISVCGAGAQLTWLYAWAAFLLFSFFQRTYPLPETIGAFCLAALLTRFHRRRRWRVIQVAGVHLAGLAGAALWIVHVFYYPRLPWWPADWLTDFFNRPMSQPDGFLLVFVLGYTILFWVAGVRLALQAKSYTYACSRFDRGMSAFFGLFLVKLVLRIQMGVQFHDTMAFWLMFPFFIFSLTEIGLTRNQGSVQQKGYLAGYYVLGVLASFSTAALILGAAVFMLFLPYLKMASVAGYDLMQSSARPLAPILIALIKFLFGHARIGPEETGLSPSAGAAGIPDPGPPDSWLLLVQKILAWGGGAILLAMGVAAAGLGLWLTLRWLFRKPAGAAENSDPWDLLSWWGRLKAWLNVGREWLLRTRNRKRAFEFYAALLRWGRFSGLPQACHETPLEYGARLADRFPKLKTEILLIVDMLHWEVYGECSLSSGQIERVRQAWKKLHSPSKWPFRIKSNFDGSRTAAR
jgi:hypothetical protein